jgi:ParB family chromosome partitioning protein
LTEVENAFVPTKPKKIATKTEKAPTLMKATQKNAAKKSSAKKQAAA